MAGESEVYGDAKDGLKRKISDSIELAKQKAQELAARLNVDAETKRARVETTYTSPVPPAGAFSQPTFYGNSQNYQSQPMSYSSYGSAPSSKKISIPNDKVGVVIGKGGDTIKSLQLQSGARIQIAKESDPSNMATRDVDLVGTAEQVSRAEELINSVLAEVDAGGSASGASYGARSGPTGGEQIVMKVPDNRVSLLIGKGGDTIKTIQSRSGARLQIVPLRPPPNEILTERSVFINGNQEQIDSAQEMVNEIVREGRLRIPPNSSGYMQPAPASWAPPGQAPNQPYQTAYEYSAAGAYPSPASLYYGDYGTNPQAGWDQSNPALVPPPQQTSGYSYYGQHNQPGLAPPAYGYGYSQPQAPVTSESSNQGYPPTSYPATSGYCQPQTYAPPPNPVAYNQGTVTPASYANPQSYSVPPTSQPAYGTSNANIVPPTTQAAYGTSYPSASQAAYGTQQALPANPTPHYAYGAQQPLTYNQAGYGGPQYSSLPPQPSFVAPPQYGQSAYPAQPPSHPSAYPPAALSAQAHAPKPTGDVSSTQVKDSSSPAVPTAPNSSSRAA